MPYRPLNPLCVRDNRIRNTNTVIKGRLSVKILKATLIKIQTNMLISY